MSSEKLSLSSAIFINLNIMISTGLFVNTVILSQRAGAAGFLLYPVIGICMLPLIASIARLLELYPSGGFYSFAKAGLGETFAFLSTWSFFFAKLASCTFMMFVSARFLQQLIPSLNYFSTIQVTLGILALFTGLNLLKFTIGVSIQGFFLTAKFIPIIFVILSGIYLFDIQALDYTNFLFTGIPTSIPLVLYSLAGFEASCSLSRNIENARVNAPKAIYYSFSFVLIVYGIFQFLLFAAAHQYLANLGGYIEVFPKLLAQLHLSSGINASLLNLLSFAIGIAALGGAYGILFSNSWNLYELANHNHLFLSSWISMQNRFSIPTACILIESLFCVMFLFLTSGSQLPLQQTASLGVTFTYTISVLSLLAIFIRQKVRMKTIVIPVLALGTCIIFIGACFQSFMAHGITSMYLFLSILAIGMIMYLLKSSSCRF